MGKFYITLGEEHRHMIDNRIWDKDAVLEIKAENSSVAENYAQRNLGKSWAMLTNEEEHIPDLYPKGTIKSVTIK